MVKDGDEIARCYGTSEVDRYVRLIISGELSMLGNHGLLSEHTEVSVYESCDNEQSSLRGHEIERNPSFGACRATEHRLYQASVNAYTLQRKALQANSGPERVADGKSLSMRVVAAFRQFLEKCRNDKRFPGRINADGNSRRSLK